MSKRKSGLKSTIELIRQVRGSWHGVNPVTKIIPDKTKYRRRPKHPQRRIDA